MPVVIRRRKHWSLYPGKRLLFEVCFPPIFQNSHLQIRRSAGVNLPWNTSTLQLFDAGQLEMKIADIEVYNATLDGRFY